MSWVKATAIAAIAVATALTPAPASAHGRLKSASPGVGARVEAAPRELRLGFTEAPELAYTAVQLLDEGGRRLPLGAPAAAGEKAIAVRVPEPLGPGEYTVVWRTAAADGHPTHGVYTFTVLAPASGVAPRAGVLAERPAGAGRARAGPEAAAGLTPPGVAPAMRMHHVPPEEALFDASSPAYVVVRLLFYLALATVIGAVAFRLLVLGWMARQQGAVALQTIEAAASSSAARIGTAAAGSLVAVAVLRLYAQSVALHGAEYALAPDRLGMLLVRTVWGWAWVLQVVATAVAIGGFAAARRGRHGGWELAAAAAAAVALSAALSGHAAGADVTGYAVIIDTLHVIGAGGWLGGLLVLVLAGVARARTAQEGRRGAVVAELVNAFSPMALGFAALTVVTGVLNGLMHVDALAELWSTPYGRVLLIKVGVVAGLACTGAYNWRYVKPSLGRDEATRHFRRSAVAELVIAAIVLAVTAVLVALPLPASS